jgi:hypothetical protein
MALGQSAPGPTTANKYRRDTGGLSLDSPLALALQAANGLGTLGEDEAATSDTNI